MVSQVTELITLRGFGFSLDGKVDVDDNGYRGDIHACNTSFITNKLLYHAIYLSLLLCTHTPHSYTLTFPDLVVSAVSNVTGQAVFVLRCCMS